MTVETLVLLPGLDGTGRLFDGLIGALPPGLNVHVARYPTDQFLSYSELVPCVREIVPSRPFLLVAESFSTPLAVQFAATRPANLAGVVLCAGFVANPVGGWAPLVRLLARSWLFRLRPPNFLLEHFLLGADSPAALRAAVREVLRLVRPKVLAGRVRAVLECGAKTALAQTEAPILYIQAQNDRLVRPACFEQIHQLRPDAALALISAPHLVFQREPGKAAEVIVRFIRQL